MILSSLITPFRIYSEYYDQDKFKKDCNNFCEFELITDKTRLLPLQFQRDKSPFPIMQTWLRPDCNNFYNKVISDIDAKFQSLANWDVSINGTIINQQGVFTNPTYPNPYGNIDSSINLNVGEKYRVKVVVIEKKVTSPAVCNLYLQNGIGNTIADFSAIQTHVYEFVATDNLLRLQGQVSGVNDFIKISEFAIEQINEFSIVNNRDYQLDNSMFQIVNIGTKDIINYCGTAFNSTLPCGKYYLILKSQVVVDDEVEDRYFFSEVITIKNFVPSQSPYVLMEWSNPCDIQNVKYTGLSCNYKNRLYIDGPITKPDYPFAEEGIENGEKSFTPTFQKWEKETFIIIPKAPEYLVDAATCIKLHETIKYYSPIRTGQAAIYTAEYKEVKSLKYEVNYIFKDCAANIELKVLLKDQLIDSACCTEIETEETTCVTCVETLEAIDVYDEEKGYALVLGDDGKIQAYQWFDPNWELLDLLPDEWPVLCVGEIKYIHIGDQYRAVPSINTLVNNGGTSFTVTGFVLPSSVVQIEFDYNGTTYILPTLYSPTALLAGITINYADIPLTLEFCVPLILKIKSYSIGCDYGYSETKQITPKVNGSC